jgi:phage baseplate assembly protein W
MPYKNIEINGAKSVSQQVTQQSQFYKGFSTVSNPTSGNKLFDFDLVKQDIVNQFNTRKGERVMNPNFGTIIWDILFEPMTQEVRQALNADIVAICNSDPRVTPTQINLTEYNQGYLLEITLVLKGTNLSSTLKLNFNQEIGLQVQQ